MLLRDQGRLDDYIKVAERLLYHRSNDVQVAKELAETYIARRDPKRALAKLQICFKADPRDVSTLSLLAEAFLMLSQTEKAVSVYREIARIHREAHRPQERYERLAPYPRAEPERSGSANGASEDRFRLRAALHAARHDASASGDWVGLGFRGAAQ